MIGFRKPLDESRVQRAESREQRTESRGPPEIQVEALVQINVLEI